jgi:hypothetical protein
MIEMLPLETKCDKIVKNEMGGACSTHGGEESCVHVSGGKPEGKKPLGRPKRRWEDNIRRIFKEWDVGIRSGLGWLRIGTGGGCL